MPKNGGLETCSRSFVPPSSETVNSSNKRREGVFTPPFLKFVFYDQERRKNGRMWKFIFSYLDRFIEILIFLIFVVIGVVGGMQVFNRFVLNRSLSWGEELQIYGHIWLIFMTIPVAYRRGSHIGMNILVRKFSQKIQKTLTLIADFMWLGLAGAIVYYSTVIMKVAKNQISPGLGLRMDLMYLSLALGGSYLGLVAIRKIVESFSRLKSGELVGG